MQVAFPEFAGGGSGIHRMEVKMERSEARRQIALGRVLDHGYWGFGGIFFVWGRDDTSVASEGL